MRPRIAALLVWGLPLAARATTIVALPELELVRHAQVIAVGTVIRTEAVLHEGGRIATRATVQIHRALRGTAANAVVTLEVPGGRMHGLVAYSPGAPVLADGDMVFGFLERSGEVLRPLGLSYGLLRVRRDAAGTHRVFRDTRGLTMIRRDGSAIQPDMVKIAGVPLDDLVLRIEQELRELEAPPSGTVKP